MPRQKKDFVGKKSGDVSDDKTFLNEISYLMFSSTLGKNEIPVGIFSPERPFPSSMPPCCFCLDPASPSHRSTTDSHPPARSGVSGIPAHSLFVDLPFAPQSNAVAIRAAPSRDTCTKMVKKKTQNKKKSNENDRNKNLTKKTPFYSIHFGKKYEYYCIIPLRWVPFCIHSGIKPVGPFSRKCAKSINQA